MPTDLSLNDYQATERQLALREGRFGFKVHAYVYVSVIMLIIAINLIFVPEFYFFPFPLLGWGFGLFMHYNFGVRRAAEQIASRQARVTAAATQP